MCGRSKVKPLLAARIIRTHPHKPAPAATLRTSARRRRIHELVSPAPAMSAITLAVPLVRRCPCSVQIETEAAQTRRRRARVSESSVAPLLLHQRLSSTRALERFRNHVGLMAMLRRGVGEVLDMYEDRCAAAAAQLGGGMHGSSQRITVCMIACLHDELRSRRA